MEVAGAMASKTTFAVNSPQQSLPARKGPRRARAAAGARPRDKAKDKENAARTRRESKQKLSKAMGDMARAARMREGLTQADVAERIGVATEVYGRLERGMLMPSVPTLRRLCLALRLQADVLLSLGTAPPPPWAEEPTAGAPEEPQMRRLLRHVRKLNVPQLRALSLVAATLHGE